MAKKPVRKSSAKSKPAAKAKKPTRRKPAPKPAAPAQTVPGQQVIPPADYVIGVDDVERESNVALRDEILAGDWLRARATWRFVRAAREHRAAQLPVAAGA